MTTFFEALAEQTEMGWTPQQARDAFARAVEGAAGRGLSGAIARPHLPSAIVAVEPRKPRRNTPTPSVGAVYALDGQGAARMSAQAAQEAGGA